MLTVYGQGASQPSRAVLWLLLMKGFEFEFCDVRIDQFGPSGALARIQPTGQVPSIEDGDFVLCEMPAIMAYLCDKHGWDDLYPRDLQARAYVDQYLHAHHERTRRVMVELMAPHVTVAFMDFLEGRGGDDLLERARRPDKLERGQARVRQIFRLIEAAYLRGTPFLCTEQPSIADIACYEELAQLTWARLFDFDEFPVLSRWLEAMSRLPGHEAAHAYNVTLGDIASQPNTIERFLAANAAAVEAISRAGIKTRHLGD